MSNSNQAFLFNQPQGIFQRNGAVYFVKRGVKESLESERSGLQALINADHSLVIPSPILLGCDHQGDFLITEGLELGYLNNWKKLAKGIAGLHQNRGGSYGWECDNWIGRDRQCNCWSDNWAKFFTYWRIKPKIDKLQTMGISVYGKEAVIGVIYEYLSGFDPEPSLVHGDLWRGNIGFTGEGAAIFDPAVYYGDGQVDIAMTKLFGSLPSEFYEVYYRSLGISDEPVNQHLIYNFYHVLNHAIIFGGHYLKECDFFSKNILGIS